MIGILESIAWLVAISLLVYALRCLWLAWRLWRLERLERPEGRWRLRH